MILHDVKNLKGRRGRVRIDPKLIDGVLAGDQEARAAWNSVFSDFVIVWCEYKYGGLSIEYEGYHPAFEKVPDGYMAAPYEVTIERQDDGAGTISFWPKWRQTP